MSTPVLLLHGALGAIDQLAPLTSALTGTLEDVHALEFSGHGTTPLAHQGFSIDVFAHDVLSFLDSRRIERATLWGYSMGGYVGLYLARHHPERIASVMTLATKFAWTPDAAIKETRMLDPEAMLDKVPPFAELLQARHAALGWRTVLAHTRQMMLNLGDAPALTPDDLRAIQCPVRIGLGDRDRMVSLDESKAAYRDLDHGSLEVYPNTRHPLERAPHQRLARAIAAFAHEPHAS